MNEFKKINESQEDYLKGKGCNACLKLKYSWLNHENELGYYYIHCWICMEQCHNYCYGLHTRVDVTFH